MNVLLSMLLHFVVSLSLGTPASGLLPSLSHPRFQASSPMILPTKREPSTSQLASFDARLLTDLSVSGILGFAIDPIVKIVFNETKLQTDKVDLLEDFLYGGFESITLAARVFGALSLAGAVLETYPIIQPEFNIRDSAPKIGVYVWVALTISTVKRLIFSQYISGREFGRIKLYDRLIDLVLGAMAVAVVLNELSVDFAMELKSIFAGGGVAALVFSLASRDLAEQIVGGFVVQSWDALEVGEDILLGDGTEGTVHKIGLVETEIMGYDNIIIRIPNKQLLNQRVSNISRINQSRVVQTLRFRYSDQEKLPDVLKDIKEEIKKSCPKLITDGSKPFRAVLTEYKADHIEAVVQCHFNIAPGCGEYYETREQLLLAIGRAIKKNDAEFAIPSIYYQSSGRETGNQGPF